MSKKRKFLQGLIHLRQLALEDETNPRGFNSYFYLTPTKRYEFRTAAEIEAMIVKVKETSNVED